MLFNSLDIHHILCIQYQSKIHLYTIFVVTYLATILAPSMEWVSLTILTASSGFWR